MLKRRLAQHMSHGRRLRRHLARRQVAARKVYATTAMPFLHRVGMVAAPPLRSGLAYQLSPDRNFLPVEDEAAEPLMEATESEQELGLANEAALPADELSTASAEAEDFLAADVETRDAEVVRQPTASSRVGESKDQTARRTADATSPPSSWQSLKKSVLAKLAHAAKPHAERVKTQSGLAAESGEPLPELGTAKSQADRTVVQSETKSPAAEQSASAPSPEDMLPPVSPDTIDHSIPDAIDQSKPDALDHSTRLEAMSSPTVWSLAVPQDAPSESAIVGPEADPVAAVQPEVMLTNAQRRRAQVQELRAELKPPTAPTQQTSRPTKPQGKAGNFPKLLPSTPPPESAVAQDLFTHRENVDRSPAAWREKLAEAMRVERENEAKQPPPPVPSSAGHAFPKLKPDATKRAAPTGTDRPSYVLRSISPQPGRLSESARRFLSPLVGFDPSEVEVHQGPAVSRMLAASGADAMAAGESILLGPGRETESPKTLGVVAHELTHIARGREVQFVPPIARPATARQSKASVSNTIAETADEEGLAQRVESEVVQAAEAAATGPIAADNVDHSAGTRPAKTARLAASIAFPAPKSREDSHGDTSSEDSWGGLPAPWEPMPDWVSAPTEAQPAVAGPAVATAVTSVGAGEAGPSAASGAPARAESGRSLPAAEAPQPAEAHEQPQGGKPPAPDLDALAKQVYSVMRRRLAADRRREFM